MASIKVAVRVRPISARELNLTGSEVVVRADSKEISLTNLKVSSSKAGDSRERTRRYGFDYCFDSSNPEAENHADQAKIYETLGQSVLAAVFSGFNSCLVAYGQSASGKTYTMTGTKEDPGLTPRLCEGLFRRLKDEEGNEQTHRVSVSYLEIYNERVRDLLKPSSGTSGLRVREHPRLGPYVQGLTHHVVRTLGSLMSYVEEGTRARKTASTLQNPSSSRSHALLTITVSPETTSAISGSAASDRTSSSARRNESLPRGGSKLHLVDLAGSESAATCSGVHRLKEGANINKSLVALGNVISALAERGSTGSGPGRRFIPYRDSSLTWLLKDALGGNATTIMLATISPASGSYNETSHTLRFAQRAQSVVNRPVVNEDPIARIIRELRAEVARLKSLLLEKNIQPDSNSPCSCKNAPTTERSIATTDPRTEPEAAPIRSNASPSEKDEFEDGKSERKNVVAVRRFNSSESVATHETDSSSSSVRRCGSCELVSSKGRFSGGYNRAKVTELNDEEDEISEINESLFVDIPTLVAVLIKPDDSLQERSAQIEEICSDEVPEDSIDAEFMENTNDRESVDHDERSSSVNSCHASVDNELGEVYQNECDKKSKEKGQFCKQDSIDAMSPPIASNLETSKRFGSVEMIQRKKESFFTLERSHTNLEKRPAASEKAKKLNNIREIDDHKTGSRGANLWRGTANASNINNKELLQRKGSNDSDKSAKDSTTKSKTPARKPSLENLKRKTSKDSSSSSSKEEQILISSLTRDKLFRRKNSLEQDPSSLRAHTPIQRVKRAEIVAAVTERLYSSRKHVEENAPGLTLTDIRSPPEGTDVKLGTSVFAAKSKLQELSRKMLAKRRRVTTDTQTDFPPTIRMRDSASLTEEPKVICQDVGVLTDRHEDCENVADRGTPVLRVKEISTLTDKPKTGIVRCKDVASLANDLEYYDYGIAHSPRNDSGILSDDTQNYAESNLSSTEVSDLCPESDRRVVCAESSTNTASSCRASAVQTPRQDVAGRGASETKTPSCGRQCCSSVQEARQAVPVTNSEKSVISISLPDMISITIESTNVLESRIAVMDGLDPTEERVKISTRNGEAQTEERDDFNNETESRFSFKDFTRSTLSQTDGRVFRIENIFQDPNNLPRTSTKTASDSSAKSGIKNSVTFTNSLGTSYAPEVEQGKARGDNLSYELQRRSFVKDGLITEAFITKKRNCSLCPVNGSHSMVRNDPWRSWTIYCPTNSIRSVDYRRAIEVTPSFCQSRNNGLLSGHLSSPCQNCSDISMEGDSKYEARPFAGVKEKTDANPSSSFNIFDSNTTLDHDHNFSDDSLDYNESNVSNGPTIAPTKIDEDRETRENLCPPDVVAHTKKESHKSSSSTELENAEVPAVSVDFENGHLQLPKIKPSEQSDALSIHDYKSLILGDPCKLHEGVPDEESDSARSSERLSTPTKKRVSFSNSNTTDQRDERIAPNTRQNSHSSLRSIIKKKRREDEALDVVRSSNEETDDSQTEDKSSLTSENGCQDNNWPSEARPIESDELAASKSDRSFAECRKKSNSSRLKRVKFSTSNHCENSCSESDSCENVDADDLRESSSRNILEEYLDEAVTFMRNMNSINEYMSATKMFEKYLGQDRRRGEGLRRKSCASLNDDYVEFMGRRVSLRDDTDEYLKEDEEIAVPTESYERCIKGIQRLENCIQKVDKQNELLREKYGINCESAGARLSLASPSAGPDTLSTRGNDSGIIDDADRIRSKHLHERRAFVSSLSSTQAECKLSNLREKNGGTKDDDLEKRIFDQLMSVADSRHSSARRLRQGRYSRVLDARSRSPTSYSKFRERLLHATEPSRGEARELRNFADTSYGNDATSGLGDYDAMTRSSDVKARFGNKAIDSDSATEDDLRVSVGHVVQCPSPKITRGSIFGDKPSSLSSDFLLRSTREAYDDVRLTDDEDLFEGPNFKTSAGFGTHRTSLRNSWGRIAESEENSRKVRDDGSTKVKAVLKSETTDARNSMGPIATGADSMSGIAHLKDKLKYPGSPRARFLELLRERRRIVESSRGTSAS